MTTARIFFIEKKSNLLRNDVPYFNQCGVDGLIVKSGQVEWPYAFS
jgi:hypothetical protein